MIAVSRREPDAVAPLVIACGALARELRTVLPDAVEVRYLPAPLHNDPSRIVPAVEALLADVAPERRVLIGYGDCGTAGGLDRLLEDHPGAMRLPGDHCYSFLAGAERYAALAGEELGTFYLTDFLARHFDSLVWRAYRLDTHPELIDMMFGNYSRVVHLAQGDDPLIAAAARAAAERLRLGFERVETGLAPLRREVAVGIAPRRVRSGLG